MNFHDHIVTWDTDTFPLMTIIQLPEYNWWSIYYNYNWDNDYDIFTPRVQSQETNYSTLAFHVDDHSESSSTYNMIIGQARDLVGNQA
jgi:hypothetical protein